MNRSSRRRPLQPLASSDLGEGNEVRVFDVRHIKGLEFEAVFFAGVDLLAVDQPDLFERYLYVGATRAATYLGLVCYGHLPEPLEALRTGMEASWRTDPSGVAN